jgi:Group II intron, maturase-specific domain
VTHGRGFGGRTIEATVADLNPVLRGWFNRWGSSNTQFWITYGITGFRL